MLFQSLAAKWFILFRALKNGAAEKHLLGRIVNNGFYRGQTADHGEKDKGKQGRTKRKRKIIFLPGEWERDIQGRGEQQRLPKFSWFDKEKLMAPAISGAFATSTD